MDLTPDLPPHPAAANAAQRETCKSFATAHSVGELVSTDPGLTARVLSLANSAYYSNGRKISSVVDAVNLLGMNNVRRLCLLAGSYPWLQGGLPAYNLAPGELLSHSLATAVSAKAVAQGMGLDGETAFTAGLLHDIGKVSLAAWVPPAHVPVRDWMAERRAISFDHAQLGGELAHRWNMPQELVEAIACHHIPVKGLEDALFLGNLMARMMFDDLTEPDDLTPLSRCGVTMEILIEISKELLPEYEKYKAIGAACA